MTNDRERRIARFHLDLALALFRAREEAAVSVADLAERSGLTSERLVAIEEGDTTVLSEIVLICDALEIAVASVIPDEARSVERYDGVARVA